MANFHAKREQLSLKQLEEVRATLPPFCGHFFLGISQTTSPLTRLNYAYDLRMFFEFLSAQVEEFQDKTMVSYQVSDLDKVTTLHIEFFIDYLSVFTGKNGELRHNNEKAKMRKLSCLRAFFKYFFKKGEIKSNVLPNIDLPKLHDKPIVRLTPEEVARLLNTINDGEQLEGRQKDFYELTRIRDNTIFIFFLTTGVRVSELVGLNYSDIDMTSGSFRITRKGGNQTILYMPDELIQQMTLYLQSYGYPNVAADSEEPLFKSLRNKRISVRAVQILVKKYARLAVPLKNISPHKLRSTFGTNLYRETKDIYIVADVLGHRDVNTTKKHYAAISDDIRKEAARKVKLPNTDR